MTNEPNDKTPSLLNVTDLLGAGSIADRLLTFLERGIGPFFRPVSDSWANFRTRRDASLQIDELRKEGLLPTGATVEVNGRATLRVEMSNIREQENREAIGKAAVGEAAALLGATAAAETEVLPEVDLDWLDQYWDLAGRINSEGRQRLWGRILARTAFGQGTSARTLNFLSTLSSDEAQQLERLARYGVRIRQDGYSGYGILRGVASRSLSPRSAVQTALNSVNGRLDELLLPLSQRHFGSIGIFVETGWAYPFSVRPNDGQLNFSIAGRDFHLRGRNGAIVPIAYDQGGLVGFASGVEIAPLGEEIFDLINAEPDEAWLSILAEGFAIHGWDLLREDGALVAPAKSPA